MKKRVFALIAVLLLAMANTAQAAVLRVPTATPELSFNNTTANAFALCTASTSDRISAKLTLYQGNTYIDSWSAAGTYRVPVSGECTVKSGKTYRLVLTWSINGVAQPSESTTRKCP